MAPKADEDTKKRKAEEKAEDKEAKKQKEVKEDAPDGEKEKDAPQDKRPPLMDAVCFNAADLTLNVVPTFGGKVLMALTEGGMQYLIAGARASVGLKSGRYMYEVKIIEALNPAESAQQVRGRVPMPRQLVRLGFSTSSSSLLLGESEEHVYFDSEGSYCAGKSKNAVSQRFTRDQVISVLLNLDSKSPNFNTLSLFREGERIAEPQPLPEALHGKVLFPHICFRNVTVQTMMGPTPTKALPFKCRMIQGAAKEDTVLMPGTKDVAGGKYEVLVPIAVPDEGTFEWLDAFLQKNPHYTEISDRKLQEWAAASGLVKPKSMPMRSSNDKPEYNYGVPSMDDFSIRKLVASITTIVPRNYVIMEVKSNLLSNDRQEVLNRFSAPHFKKVAHVVMGEPPKDFKALQLERLLQEKQEKANAEFKLRQIELQKKKEMELRQKLLQDARVRQEEARKKALEDAKKRLEEEAKRKLEELKQAEGKEESEVKMDVEEVKPEVKEEETEVKEEAKEEPKDEEMKVEAEPEVEEEPPVAELTEEEQKLWFKPSIGGYSDVLPPVLNQVFGDFSLPEKAEGFNEVRYEWQKEDGSKAYLKKWILDRKLTTRMDDLQPSQWFKDKQAEWMKLYQEWQAKQKAFKATPAGKKLDEKKEESDAGAKEAADLDIFSVEDVCDVGGGLPLFAKFAMEDWALLQLRYELYLLQKAFTHDVNDPERIGIHDDHLAFYYTKYYRKSLNPKAFGVETNTQLTELVKDTAAMTSDTKVLKTQLAEDVDTVDIFVKLTEEQRRERQRRIDAGDETAKLKFNAMALNQQPAANALMAATLAAQRPGAAGWQQQRPGVAWNQAQGLQGKGAFFPGSTAARPAWGPAAFPPNSWGKGK